MTTVRLACDAMATRFECVLHGPDERVLRAAGEEALDEVRRLEAALSLYRPESEIAQVNREAARDWVPVSPEVFGLVRHALLLSHVTEGAFDITVGPLLRTWGLMRGSGRRPGDDEVAEVRQAVGSRLVELDEASFRLRFARPGVMLDLGSIGKGYAVDRAGERLREAGVEHAFLHGGTSTALAMGSPLEGDVWKVAIEHPLGPAPEGQEPRRPLAVIPLRDESLSVSAVWGKGFEAEGVYYGHVMDPRLGRPVAGARMAAITLPSATETDAMSTALLVRGGELVEKFRAGGFACRCLVVENAAEAPGYRVVTNGISWSTE